MKHPAPVTMLNSAANPDIVMQGLLQSAKDGKILSKQSAICKDIGVHGAQSSNVSDQ